MTSQKNLSTLNFPPLFFGLAAKRNINFERPWVILKPMKEENVFNKKCSELGNMMCIYIPYLHWSLTCKWFLYFGTSPYIELLIVCIGSNFINTTGFLVIFLVWKSLKYLNTSLTSKYLKTSLNVTFPKYQAQTHT